MGTSPSLSYSRQLVNPGEPRRWAPGGLMPWVTRRLLPAMRRRRKAVATYNTQDGVRGGCTAIDPARSLAQWSQAARRKQWVLGAARPVGRGRGLTHFGAGNATS